MPCEDDKPAMIPGAVVAHVLPKEPLNVRQLSVPERKVTDQPLAIGPDVVVFDILGEHVAEEVNLISWQSRDVRHHYLAVMPETIRISACATGAMTSESTIFENSLCA